MPDRLRTSILFCKLLHRTIRWRSQRNDCKAKAKRSILSGPLPRAGRCLGRVINSLPNTNVADAVGRLPSVSLERDEGEGKYVQIRGTEPRLSNVTINGVNVPSPEGVVRNIKLDAVPANLVERIEVFKTLSASQ